MVEEKEEVLEEKKEAPIHKIKVKIVGVGGGAGSIIGDIASDYERTEFIVADTDQSVLSGLSRKKWVKTIRFGRETTEGMGTGMNTELGKQAAREDEERMRKALRGADLLIFVSCLGGGTGSGAVPVFARVASEMDAVSLGMFTLPFDFEREKKLETAKKTLGELRSLLDGIAVVPNQRVFEVVDEKVPIKKALSAINEDMGESLEGLIEMIHSPGLINIDFADLVTILKEEGPLAYLTRGRVAGEGRVKEVLAKIERNPLYPYGFEGARGALFNIEAPQNLSLSEVAEISRKVAQESKEGEAKVIFGVNLVRGKKQLDVTLLAVGCREESLFPDLEEERAEKENEGEKEEEKEEELKKKKGEEKTERLGEDVKVRKNALQVQKDLRAIEEELLKKEEKWEKPAFLRREKK